MADSSACKIQKAEEYPASTYEWDFSTQWPEDPRHDALGQLSIGNSMTRFGEEGQEEYSEHDADMLSTPGHCDFNLQLEQTEQQNRDGYRISNHLDQFPGTPDVSLVSANTQHQVPVWHAEVHGQSALGPSRSIPRYDSSVWPFQLYASGTALDLQTQDLSKPHDLNTIGFQREDPHLQQQHQPEDLSWLMDWN